MSSPRVLHVITGTAIGGAEIMLLRYLRALGDARRDHMVVSMMPPGPIAGDIAEMGVAVTDIGMRSARELPFKTIKLTRVIKRFSPDVVHGWMYHGCLISTLALMAMRRKETALLWGIHHSLSDPKREKRMTQMVLRVLRRLQGRADLMTYCSRVSRAQHRKYGFEHVEEKFIPNAIDINEFVPDAQARHRLTEMAGIAPDRLIIGGMGRAHPMKDHVTFMRVVQELLNRGQNVHGLLIGLGQENGEALAWARDNGLADRLTALPARQDIAQLVPGVDVYLSSSAWGEALPLAVGEAMAAGVPAVVTDVGDCTWLVGDCGLVCPPRDVAALSDAVSAMLALTPQGRAELAMRGRALIAERMSMQHYVAAHSVAYDAAIANRRGSGAPQVV